MMFYFVYTRKEGHEVGWVSEWEKDLGRVGGGSDYDRKFKKSLIL